ncbi:MAG: glutamate-5-semialdehyde dehydrogenase [Zhenhengia sp.]|jgi:glutamate-5-semialdehyde dehydrogenase|uniref:glutamate-5-semialdehyde dehydrogenase n=1 Tax=Zhenhengia sp. TaxID=2944208 RepID=UPI00290ACC6A|nr:glutamate-5-semialdehyde dehydrogenase [Clostridiales bacterium]MDU6973015.1 glutamate-5-semialdehyde dehydrogenase [Clostridiales bacterium]
MNIYEAAKKAREASIILQAVESDAKRKALESIKEALEAHQEAIFKANQVDIEMSEAQNVSMPVLKRLRFDKAKLQDVLDGIESLVHMKEPVGKVQMQTELDEGLILTRVSCPIGVIGVIFESRPDALVQISSLCLKSGNAVLLKGGSEAKETNKVLFEIIKKASEEAGMPEGWITLMETREEVSEILKMNKEIDLLIPRGSNEFVQYIMRNSDIPVMGHADGICHTYVDEHADLDLAVKVVTDSKTQYVSVCNALETLLVHEKVANDFLPRLKESLESKGATIKGCAKTRAIIECEEATEEDWQTEYLDYILSIKIVSSLEEAICHINTYGSGHTDCIVSTDEEAVQKFMMLVDSGNVFCNVSTRFSDGFRYGFGAEVGVSTSKIHARGPVGIEGLLIYKYKLLGHGHIVGDYASGVRKFTHKKLV